MPSLAQILNKVQIVKRNNRRVEFDSDRIEAALRAAFKSTNEKITRNDLLGLVQEVMKGSKDIAVNDSMEVTVEQVQDLCEQTLIKEGFNHTGRAYMDYRDHRTRMRGEHPISDDVVKAFELNRDAFETDYQIFNYLDKYARFDDDLGRRECWPETVSRVMGFLKWHMKKQHKGVITPEEWAELHDGMLGLSAMPAMRLVQMAGPAAKRCCVCTYNCAYIAIDSLDSFVEMLYVLMQGTGCGFSVESEYVHDLPKVKRRRLKATIEKHTVKDSTEGWCNSLRLGLERWVDGYDVEYDYSQVRAFGAPLKTKGGFASGSDPLKRLHDLCRAIIFLREKQRLHTIDCHDICCCIGDIVHVGGVRRAAEISLSDLDDHEMRHAKDGEYWKKGERQRVRNMANNSAVYEWKPTSVEFMEEWLSLSRAGTGERGIFNRGGAWRNNPKRRKKAAFGSNPCITGDTLVYTADGRGAVPIKKLAKKEKDVPVFCLDNNGDITIRMMRRPRVTGYNKPILKITLDDGSVIRCTKNHKLMLRGGLQYKQAKDLQPGDSLRLVTTYEPQEVISCDSNVSWADRYRSICTGGVTVFEHIEVARFHHGEENLTGFHVHHKNECRLDNRPTNLTIKPSTDHLSDHSQGDSNPTYSGVTNDELIDHGRHLTRIQGQRFSTQQWLEYAIENDLPQSFSQWRRTSLGTVMTFSKQCAILEDVDTPADVDLRVIRTYQSMIMQGLDAEIVDGRVLIHKVCEHCNDQFTVWWKRREQGFCSLKCSYHRTLTPEQKQQQYHRQAEAFETRRLARREQQVQVYLDLIVSGVQEPTKSEWVTACKSSGISTEIGRASSPFKSLKELKEAATVYNHKVVTVEDDGHATVYNGTVDEFHNFLIGGWDGGETKQHRNRTWWIVNKQCGEILLKSKQFCNLSLALVRPDDDMTTIKHKVRLATMFGTIQSTLTNFKYLCDTWKNNCEEERLLGVDIPGAADNKILKPFSQSQAETLGHLQGYVIGINETFAQRLGINPSAATTCVKPGGNSGATFRVGHTITGWPFKQCKRHVRVMNGSAMCRFLMDAQVPHWPEYNDPNPANPAIWVFAFPLKAPEGAHIAEGDTAMSQLENWLQFKKHWTEHNPSVSIYVKPDEWMAVGSWVLDHWDLVGGLSFFPKSDHVFALAPFEPLSEAEYEAFVAKFPARIPWEKLVQYEKRDERSGTERECSGPTCLPM